MFAFDSPRPRRKPSLTPMIDVVFLLLVFFMLASRFGMDTQVPLNVAGQGQSPYSGPPRLVDILPDSLRLNGQVVAVADLPSALADLMEAPSDTIVLRARDEAQLQRLVDVMQHLQRAGFTGLVLVE
ncbi:biopolymer transporter ExbD [Roseovarius gahaiensis]|uniref:Biopolymer transporter ExbD n=1 Tax=Roseovarius gahaiensis TaxID=2716691 RepID=A0A967BDT7_9RHOB|nr:biopolymer transporter ExbD [Roseovarius gahaiensis]NHQ74665.1 biopolymer transporter ExbD [Roseovarius gahaiensis]